MRLFIAIDIPDQLKAKIIKVQEKFKDFDIKFVEKENFHFNLRFLGEVSEETAEKIKQIISQVSEKFNPFKIRIQGIGTFPSKNYIRVIWLGVRDGENIISIAQELDNSLVNLGFKRDRVVPHLTIGRVKSGRNREDLIRLIESLEINIGEMEISEIKLYESILTKKGPVYKEVFSPKLGE